MPSEVKSPWEKQIRAIQTTPSREVIEAHLQNAYKIGHAAGIRENQSRHDYPERS